MYPFWDPVVAPLIEAVGARRVLEIGALRGDTTVRMLEGLAPGSELHVIDPVPAFDPSEHERAFPGRYLFHRRPSLEVLPELPAFDVALVDGDHNWYTVFHELQALAATSAAAGEPLPLLILHDVCWPYGRRDLYYEPERIPAEFRHEHRQGGMVIGESKLRKRGGLNPTMWNAAHEGGPRNGVMTAIEDFLEAHGRPHRLVVLPVYFGLAVVADDQRLAASPALGPLLDRLEGPEGLREMMELAEDTRLRAMVTQHGIFFSTQQRQERAAQRYLGLLEGALRDEHYLENELRIDLLLRCIERGVPLDRDALRDPVRRMRERAQWAVAARRSGQVHDDDPRNPNHLAYAPVGRPAMDAIRDRLDLIRTESVAGDLIVCGPGRGGLAMLLRGYLEAYEMQQTLVWVAGPFLAWSEPADGTTEQSDDETPLVLGRMGADLNAVREGFARFDLLDDRVRFLQGTYADVLAQPDPTELAALVIGAEVGEQADTVLDSLYDRLTLGGHVIVEAPAAEAAERFRARRGVTDQLDRFGTGMVGWRKLEHRPDADAARPAPGSRRVPLAPPLPAQPCDLSIVVVFYDMKREAARTLRSLSRSYQQDIDDLDYEVIVVENGSHPEQRLGEEYVRSFGPEFRYLDMGAAATSSPVPALNRGVAESRGRAVGLMIDGAHVLTPGVLRFARAGLETYAPSVVVTQQWYVGPGQQGDAMTDGYDQAYEDRLFEEIDWPADGYRLFDIGHFIGARDWLDGLWESNCIFVPRPLLEQVGGFDESFTMPGGGFANLELYERLGSSPDVAVTTILGEGSFHQVHGGTTTNVADSGERHDRIASYARHYQEIRGRSFIGHRKRIHYVGTMFDAAARTRARRKVAPNFFKRAATAGPDGRPDSPEPIPQELLAEFTEAYWRSLAWRETQWLGRPVRKPPTDLFAYQELLARRRPDWVIETGTGGGGRAWFLAGIMDLLDKGRVVSIDRRPSPTRPEHPRITYLTGDPLNDEIQARVAELVDGRAMLVLGGLRNANATTREFRAYERYVPVGGYAVIEDTIVNGHPVWANFGPGPSEAVKGIVEARDAWASDLEMEKYKLTFNRTGYLKRLH